MSSADRNAYIEKWKKENTDIIRFRVPKGKKAVYQDLAYRSGDKSLTIYLNRILEEKLQEDKMS